MNNPRPFRAIVFLLVIVIATAFSRALQAPLTGSNEWSTQSTPFLLRQGDNPDNAKLNLVVNGTGTVWIDDIRLIMAPLP
jgi:hypothetical protein